MGRGLSFVTFRERLGGFGFVLAIMAGGEGTSGRFNGLLKVCPRGSPGLTGRARRDKWLHGHQLACNGLLLRPFLMLVLNGAVLGILSLSRVLLVKLS